MKIKEDYIERVTLLDIIEMDLVGKDSLKKFILDIDDTLVTLNKEYLRDIIIPMLEKHPISENTDIILFVCDELFKGNADLSNMYLSNPHYVINYMKASEKVKVELLHVWNREQIRKFKSINNIIDRYGNYDEFVDLKLKAPIIDIISPLFDSGIILSACDICRFNGRYLLAVRDFNKLTKGKCIGFIMDKNTSGNSIGDILYYHNRLYILNQEKYNVDWLRRVIDKYKNAKIVSEYLYQMHKVLSDPDAIYKDIKDHIKFGDDGIVNIISINVQKDPISLIKEIYSGKSLNYIIKRMSTLVNFVDKNYPFCANLRQQLRDILDTLIEEDFQN